MIDTRLEKYFNDVYSLVETEGWKTLVSDIKADAININSVELTKDNNDLQFRKGQLNVMAHIINFETSIKTAHDNALADEAEEATAE
tara:strand:- start:213 stop:473 length:261 start_codon:yes stop_codon:yes gene_type:complete